MYKKGYIINDDYNRKYATIRSINDKKWTRMYQLGEEYIPKNIAERVNHNPYYKQNIYLEMFKKKRPKKYKVYRYKGGFKSISKMTGIEMLFMTLFYFMGLLPKEKPNYKPLSPEMKQEVRKMQRYSNQIRLVAREKLITIKDVQNFISQTEKDIVNITNIRQKYRNKLRNCKANDLVDEYKAKIDTCTTILEDHRKNLKIANQIIEDVPRIKEVVKIEKQMRNEELTQNKEKNRNRGGR